MGTTKPGYNAEAVARLLETKDEKEYNSPSITIAQLAETEVRMHRDLLLDEHGINAESTDVIEPQKITAGQFAADVVLPMAQIMQESGTLEIPLDVEDEKSFRAVVRRETELALRKIIKERNAIYGAGESNESEHSNGVLTGTINKVGGGHCFVRVTVPAGVKANGHVRPGKEVSVYVPIHGRVTEGATTTIKVIEWHEKGQKHPRGEMVKN